MPLLDHFRPPLSDRRHWESIHALWSGEISGMLNEKILPEHYYAKVQVHVGSRVEVDVATFGQEQLGEASEGGTLTATAPARVWTPTEPTLVMPAVRLDSVAIRIINGEGGPTLVAAIELVSPGNKDREEARRAFAVKCANYLHQGVGLVVLDVVTTRRGNLHNVLVDLLSLDDSHGLPEDALYATAYRPALAPEAEQVEVWHSPLQLGQNLPTMPLALDRGQIVPLDLETPYREVCRRNRLST